jgi:hypothetical protein
VIDLMTTVRDKFKFILESISTLTSLRNSTSEERFPEVESFLADDLSSLADLRRQYLGSQIPVTKKISKTRVVVPQTLIPQPYDDSVSRMSLEEKRRLLALQHVLPESFTPYRVLWLKVVIRAAYDYALWKNSTDIRLRKFAQDAAKWLFESSTLPNSFDNICFFFRLPKKELRVWAKELTREQVKKFEFLERTGKDPITLALYGPTSETPDGDSQ